MEVETIKPQLFISSRCDRACFQPYENDVYLSLTKLVESSEDYFVFPVCHGVIVPASGRRLDLGCTTGRLCSFTNQVLAKLDLMRSVVLASSIQERCLPLAETARCVCCIIAPSFIRSSAHRLCPRRVFRTSLFLQRPNSTSTLWTT